MCDQNMPSEGIKVTNISQYETKIDESSTTISLTFYFSK